MKHLEIQDYAEKDYASFWKGDERRYFDDVEQIIVRKLLPSEADWFADLGCGFGRFKEAYVGRYRNVIMLDYSRSLLLEAKKSVQNPGSSRFYFVLADIYNLPFRDGSLDAALMARVFHHLKEPDQALRQIRRILRPKGELVFNYYNKRNLREILRSLLRKPGLDPFRVEHVNTGGDELLYYSHPAYIALTLQRLNFSIQRKLGVGIFFGGLFSKVYRPAVIEKLLSPVLGRYSLSALVFLKAVLQKEPPDLPVVNRGDAPFSEMLICPSCRASALEDRSDAMICSGCRASFPVMDGIYDFRLPK